ncbi:cilia- and flagella-associated protein 221-like [Anneissia japonica]|uniref:cilia- and flagella-associated protein 221-like n=1 Tax=Anneissia japonica TaxID=1529436 RepID=UPI001425ACE0|nr:cilia- and flagella-associated protein 221-like [Anneissia japonica]
MAVARPLSQVDLLTSSQNALHSTDYTIPDTLVVPYKSKPVPNHLLDTKIFHNVAQNEVIQARPASIHYAGFEPGKLHKMKLTIANVSTEVVKMHIIPPTTQYFKVWYTKGDRLVPGLTMDCTVEFRPDEWRYFYDCIRIHCKGDNNLLVPIHAYPVMNISDFPQIVRFPPTPISQSKTQVFPLRCNAPIDFEFLITYLQPHPSFQVEPLKGIVPAKGETRISVTFTPTDFSTAHLKFQVMISQFNSKPLVCAVSGNSTPGLAQAELNLKTSEPFDATSQLDPHSISPIGLVRKKKLAKIKKSSNSQPTTTKTKAPKEIEKNGIRFPTKIDSQHAVNSVLLQEAGKLRVKDLREVFPRFDTYTNDLWTLRYQAIVRFQQAARKYIIRSRVDKKLPVIRQLIADFKAGRAGKPPSVTFGEEMDEEILEHVPLDINTENVKSWAFPTYTAPDYKDDMAPDALGIVPIRRTDVVVKKNVSFSDLTVPKHYKLMGYKKHSVHQASYGYVPPKLARPLRTGAEDEVINMPIPQAAWTQERTDKGQDERLVTSPEPERQSKKLKLAPPSALFQPTEYPPLHIFNPCPGLQTFLSPLPYSEVDPDFHLCPLPRYTHGDKSNKHGTMLKTFLDREDVIRHVMQWKKFPSQGLVSLANTPTLTNVWVPRWTDPFSTELLPLSVPPLLDGLPEDDQENILTEKIDEDDDEIEVENTIMLTPDMVSAEFSLIDRPLTPDDKESDEFPYGTKLPTHNNPVSSTGPVPRERREQELEGFLQKRYNQLGQKIESRIGHMNGLLTDPKLALK